MNIPHLSSATCDHARLLPDGGLFRTKDRQRYFFRKSHSICCQAVPAACSLTGNTVHGIAIPASLRKTESFHDGYLYQSHILSICNVISLQKQCRFSNNPPPCSAIISQNIKKIKVLIRRRRDRRDVHSLQGASNGLSPRPDATAESCRMQPTMIGPYPAHRAPALQPRPDRGI